MKVFSQRKCDLDEDKGMLHVQKSCPSVALYWQSFGSWLYFMFCPRFTHLFPIVFLTIPLVSYCINSSPVYLSMSNLTVPPQALRQVDHQAPNQVPNRRVFLVRSHHHSRLVCPPFSGHSITTMEARLLWRIPPISFLARTSKWESRWLNLPVSILETQSSPCPISL